MNLNSSVMFSSSRTASIENLQKWSKYEYEYEYDENASLQGED